MGDPVPARLQAITDTHLAWLLALVQTLRAAGMDEALVHHSLRELVDVMTSLAHKDPG